MKGQREGLARQGGRPTKVYMSGVDSGLMRGLLPINDQVLTVGHRESWSPRQALVELLMGWSSAVAYISFVVLTLIGPFFSWS